MRLDRLLVFLRFARSRSRAKAMVASGLIRINRKRATRSSAEVECGDVLTLMHGNSVRIVEIIDFPRARVSSQIVQNFYRELDRTAQTAIAAPDPVCDQEDPAP